MALVAGFVAFLVLGPPLGVVALLAGGAVEVGELYLWRRYLRRFRVRTGAEGMIGAGGVVTAVCRPDDAGQVRVRGELWRALPEGPEPLGVGTEVTVRAVHGLTVTVASAARSE